MNVLVEQDRVVPFGCCPGYSVNKLPTVWHVDAVELSAVVGHVASIVDVGSQRLNEAINLLELLGSIFIDRYRVGPAVNLFGIKDGGTRPPLFVAILISIAPLLVRRSLLCFFPASHISLEEVLKGFPKKRPVAPPEGYPVKTGEAFRNPAR